MCIRSIFSLLSMVYFISFNVHLVWADESSGPPIETEEVKVTDAVQTMNASESIQKTSKDSLNGLVIKRSFLDKLPFSDDLFVSFSLAPGVNGSGDIRVHGGAFNDNLYLFDDIDTTEALTSLHGAIPYADTIDTISILTGAFPAEYGRSMGGIISGRTRSGTNNFHGTLRYKSVNSNTRSSDKWSDYRILSDYDYNDYAATIDGPVIADKLWIMVSYNFYAMEKSEKWGYPSDYYYWGYSRGTQSINQDKDYRFPMARLTFQPTDDHTIVMIYNGQSMKWNNYSGFDYGASPETYNTLEEFEPYYGAEWNWRMTPQLELTAFIGASFHTYDDKPSSENDTDPPFCDTYFQMRYNNSETWLEDDRQRYQYRLSADYRLDDWFGSHEWKTGLDYQLLETDNLFKIPGGGYYVISQNPVGDWQDPDYYTGNEATRTVQLFPGSTEATGRYMAFYLQDDWMISDRLSLNVGIRYENMRYENDDGDTDMPAWRWGDFARDSYLEPGVDPYGNFIYKSSGPMEFDALIAPRIGVEWDLSGDGGTALHAFYGRYYDPFDMSLPAMFQPFESDPWAMKYQEYTGPEWTDMNKDGVPDEGYFFDSTNWHTYSEDTANDRNLIDPDLKPEYTDEISVGIRHDLTSDISVGITYTNRRTRDLIEDVGLFTDDDGNIVWTYRGGVKNDFSGLDPRESYDPRDDGRDYSHQLYWITNADGNRRDYSGFDIMASIRKQQWELMANYTWSEAKGTVIEGPPGAAGIAQFSGLYDTYYTSQNLYGELPWSCRHYLKLAGFYRFDLTDWYEMSFGMNAFLRSGYAYSKRTTPPYTFDPDNESNVYDDPSTWTGRPPYRSYAWYYPEGRGSYELPSYYNIDVSWQNTFAFGSYGALTVIFDVNNVTDYQGILSESDVYNAYRPDLFGRQNSWGMPREYRWSLKYSF